MIGRIEKDHFKQYQYLNKFEINAREDIVYRISTVNCAGNGYRDRIYLWEKDGSPQEILFDGDVEQFYWQDEKRLFIKGIFSWEDKERVNNGEELSVFYHYDIKSRQHKELCRFHSQVSFCEELAEEKFLFTQRDDLNLHRDSDFFTADEAPFWDNGSGYSNRIRSRLYLKSGESCRMLTPVYMDVYDIKVKKGEYAIFYGLDFSSVRVSTSQLYVLDFVTMEIREIGGLGEYLHTEILPVSCDEIIVLRSDRRFYGEDQNEYIDKINIKDGTYQRLNEKGERHLYNGVLTDITYGATYRAFAQVNGGIYFIATENDQSDIFYGDFASGAVKKITDGSLMIWDFRYRNNKLWMLAMDGLNGLELWCMEVNGGSPQRLTSYNRWITESFNLSVPEKFGFKTQEGIDIFGYAMRPVDFEPGKKYKTILFIHGGPNCIYGRCFSHDMQLMSSAGYGVIYCNPRGSEGRGGEFADLRNRYYTIDYDDIMRFVSESIQKYPWIDPEHLAVTGGSYGGMMVNWMIGHTNMFKVAISDRSSAEEVSSFCMSDIGFSFGQNVYGMTPWDEGGVEKYWEKSPIRYAAQVKTPTLFIHGELDYTCNKEQSLQMFSALKYHGVPSRVFIAKGENHDLCREGSPKARIRRLEEMLKWLQTYL